MQGIGKTAGRGALVLALWGSSAGWLSAQPAAPSSAAPQVVAPAVAPEPEAALPTLPAPVATALRATRLPGTALGIYVQEVGSNRPLLSVNADK